MISRSVRLRVLGLVLSGCWTLAVPTGALATVDSSTKIPADFPTDIPVYQNARLRSYGPIIRTNPKLGSVLVLVTSDSKADVLEFYKKELPEQGWQVQPPFSGAPDTLVACKTERRISVSVLDSQAEGKRVTLIQLGVNGTSSS